MLSDRPYMRDAYSQERSSVLAWLISATVAGFVLQNVATRVFTGAGDIEHLFGLSIGGLKAWRFWGLLTYGLLHDPNNILHIIVNLLGLFFIGRALLPVLGAKRFLALYAGAVFLGGVVWAAANWHLGGTLIGASAGVFGLLIVYACFYPNQPMTILVLFIFPVTVKPKYVAMAALLIDLLGCLCYEVLGYPSPFGLAHSAHLGGMAAGWFYYRYVHEARWRLPGKPVEIELPRWAKKAGKAVATGNFQVNVGPKSDLRAEVDRILDKINSQGFGALTPEEKRVLDEAKDLLSRR
ncbi:MAG TPA: rhomboid family intramembrane serine protease [Opitutaceae bacterium]|nr:rhomboid family intramembrane serine protease [Opitutaceae bacterium]HND62969.1 rhomboid family intramembrane serine protease [Opitutaceae bacterium]